MQIKVQNPFLDFLWKQDTAVELTASPGCLCAYVTWCEVSGSQQTITTRSGLCLWGEVHPCNGNAEFVLWPSLSQLLVSIFLNLLIQNGLLHSCQRRVKPGSEAGNSHAESCNMHHWREEEHCQVHCWKEEEQRQIGQVLALRKWSTCQELCKPEMCVCVGRQTLTSNTNVEPPCDSFQGNPCHAHVIWVRICLKGLLEMATLALPHFSLLTLKTSLSDSLSNLCLAILAGCWLFYLLRFWGKTFWKSVLLSGSQCYRVCATFGSHQKIPWKYFTLWNREDSGLAL